MPSLIIPTSGMSLESSQGPSTKGGPAGIEVLGLTLTDDVIEEMIKCVQNRKPIQLSLGEHPSLTYGTKAHSLSTFDDPFTHELFRTGYDRSTNSGMASSNAKQALTMRAGFLNRQLGIAPKLRKSSNLKNVSNVAKSTYAAAAVGADAAVAALQSSLATEEAKKVGNSTKFLKDGALPLPGQKRGPISKSKLSNHRSFLSDANRSTPTSPALSGVGSPSLGPTSAPASQKQFEDARVARKPVVHFLAIEPLGEKVLREKLSGVSKHELKQLLTKAADLDETTDKWVLKKAYYKELDVWAFDYENSADRQRAIENAVRQFDKMRMGVSEPEWDRLLPRSERGTGKCLSKLQASIATGTARAAKVNPPKTDSGRESNGEESDKAKGKSVKGKPESSGRPGSQTPIVKMKKASEKDAQAKRLLSKKPAPPKLISKPALKKQSTLKSGPKVLSSEYINDSDDDEPPVSLKPLPKPATTKRSRPEEEGDTSDSSIPLAKKLKKDTIPPPHRISDASQSSRTTQYSSTSFSKTKSKSNSPQKSSPLASSPPTNASDFETFGRTSSSTSPVQAIPLNNRHQKSSSVASSISSTTSTRRLKPEVVDLARKFVSYYKTYADLHAELSGNVGPRDREKEGKLLQMHERLEGMKKEILAGIIED